MKRKASKILPEVDRVQLPHPSQGTAEPLAKEEASSKLSKDIQTYQEGEDGPRSIVLASRGDTFNVGNEDDDDARELSEPEPSMGGMMDKEG